MNNDLNISFFILIIIIGTIISRLSLASPDYNNPNICTKDDPKNNDKISIASGRSEIDTEDDFESPNYELVDDIVRVCSDYACNIGSESGFANWDKIISYSAVAGIVPIDVAYNHHKDGGIEHVISVIPLNLQTMHIIVSYENKDINTFRDLSRNNVKVGLWGSANDSFKIIINILNIHINDDNRVEYHGSDHGKDGFVDLKEGKIQAYIVMGAQPYNLVKNEKNVKLIGFSAIDIQNLTYNRYHPIKINGSHYQHHRVTDKTYSISSRNELFAMDNYYDIQKLKEFKDCIKHNIKEIQSKKHHPSWNEIDINSISEWTRDLNSQ